MPHTSHVLWRMLRRRSGEAHCLAEVSEPVLTNEPHSEQPHLACRQRFLL